MNPYRTRTLEGASGVELTAALYDGIIRFMHHAIDAVERGDTRQRRIAVKRAMDIVIHLQVTLQMDIGGKAAEALAEFYVAMFALMLQGSQANSREKFEQVIICVRNVRDAWRQAANPTQAVRTPSRFVAMHSECRSGGVESAGSFVANAAGSNWTA